MGGIILKVPEGRPRQTPFRECVPYRSTHASYGNQNQALPY